MPLGPNPIVQLDPKARILIASQAPGSVAHNKSIPFMDKSGERLRDWMGISEQQFYNSENVAILPMGFCYPGKGQSGDLPPAKVCADKWRVKVLSELKNIQLTLLVGNFAQKWHLQHQLEKLSENQLSKTLTQRVICWHDYLPKYFPVPHPSPRNNIWLKRNTWFEAELVPELRKRVGNILR